MSASAFRFARVLIPRGHQGDDAARGRADDHHLQSQDSDLSPGRLGYPGSIYDLAGQPLKPASRTAVEEFLAVHTRGRHGAVDYQPTPLGIGHAEGATALASYATRFNVTIESATSGRRP
jgi:hypothetical protein